MELRHLRYFLAVAHHHNFTRAARELHLAQPPLSQQIQQLERELGVTLFDRTGHQIALTPAGRELERRATDLFVQLDELVQATQDVAEARAGSVRLGVISSAAGTLVPQIATRFRQQLPAVELVIQEAGSTTIAQLLLERQVDLGVARLPLGAAIPSEAIASVGLGDEPVILVVPQGHRFAARGEGVAIAELADDPWMLVRRDQGTLSDLVLDACAAAGFTPHVVCEGAEIATLLRLVAVGVGITVIPARGLGLTPMLAETVVGVPLLIGPERRTLSLTLGMIWRRQGYTSQAARALADIILAVAAE